MSERDVVTPVGRLSYPHLFERQEPMNAGEEGKFGAAIIFEEGTDLQAVKAAILAAGNAKFGADGFAKLMKSGKARLPLRDDWEDKGYPENSVFFNARSGHQPSAVSRYADPETGKARQLQESELYPGAEVKFHVTAYGYDVKGNKGVALGLNHVQKWADADRLDGRRSADAVFEVEQPASVDLSAMEDAADGVSVPADEDLTALM